MPETELNHKRERPRRLKAARKKSNSLYRMPGIPSQSICHPQALQEHCRRDEGARIYMARHTLLEVTEMIRLAGSVWPMPILVPDWPGVLGL